MTSWQSYCVDCATSRSNSKVPCVRARKTPIQSLVSIENGAAIAERTPQIKLRVNVEAHAPVTHREVEALRTMEVSELLGAYTWLVFADMMAEVPRSRLGKLVKLELSTQLHETLEVPPIGTESLSELIISDFHRLTRLTTGVERSIGLKSLSFDHCSALQDVTALVACTALTQISIRHASKNLETLEGLGMIPNLNSVKLFTLFAPMDFNASLKCIAECASLRTLYLEGPGFESLDGLEKVTSLQSLTLHNVRVMNLRMLGNLPALTEFSLEKTHHSDVSALGTCSALQKLNIDAYMIRQFSGLEALTVLHTAVLRCSSACNVSAIVSIASLQRLVLKGVGSIDVDPGSIHCNALTYLKIIDASIYTFALLHLTRIKDFPFRQLRKVSFVGIRSFFPGYRGAEGCQDYMHMLASCERLEHLRMKRCFGYPNLSGLIAQIKSLTTVVLVESPIEDVSELLTLPHLRTLKLRACIKLRKIWRLDTALALQSLEIRDCTGLEYVNIESAPSCLTVTVEGECPWTLMAKSREGACPHAGRDC
jgi:Leucine-rich repeat (LRR) protein